MRTRDVKTRHEKSRRERPRTATMPMPRNLGRNNRTGCEPRRRVPVRLPAMPREEFRGEEHAFQGRSVHRTHDYAVVSVPNRVPAPPRPPTTSSEYPEGARHTKRARCSAHRPASTPRRNPQREACGRAPVERDRRAASRATSRRSCGASRGTHGWVGCPPSTRCDDVF